MGWGIKMQNQFFVNHEGPHFIDFIKEHLGTCKEFIFSVSFIKHSGLSLIKKDIIHALDRGVMGKIITSTYQNFTDTVSLSEFLNLMKKYTNFECHLEKNNLSDGGMHTKGYLFNHGMTYTLLVGSTNLTRFALLHNIEWNLVHTSISKTGVYQDAENQFYKMWDKTELLTQKNIDRYAVQLEYAIEKWDMDYFQETVSTIKPNYLQRKALKELRRFRDQGVHKALIIAATGSGKTYLAAFDARNYGASRLLFVVHRESILHDAMRTFQNVFGQSKTYGYYTGTEKDISSDFLFATNLTLANNLDVFDDDFFQYIVLDEVHHAAASTYQKIINYFKPEFLLGLTATPDRMDNQDIYGLFDKNVPFDLPLRDAIINDLVVPFHYYGIRNQLISYDEKEAKTFIRQIGSSENGIFIKEEIERYKPLQGKLKAIGFCSTTEHARLMSEVMNQLGYHSIHLQAYNNTGERLSAFKDLQDESHPLEIIFAVDILNEGVDIPGINMVLFIRPTDSPVIFLQQLGRGLRKYPGKDYLTVLDFIGNSYKRSIQIIRALGTLSKSTVLEKKLLINLLRDDFKEIDIPGVEINFDALSKEDIEQYLVRSNFNTTDYLKKDFENFKRFIKAEPYPSHMDYLNHDIAPDLMRFLKSRIGGKKNVSYYRFLSRIDQQVPVFNEEEIAFIDFISDMLPLVRVEEFALIKELIEGERTIEELKNVIEYEYDFYREDQFDNAIKHLLNQHLSEREKEESYDFVSIHDETLKFNVSLENATFKNHIEDILSYGIARYQDEFGIYEGTFKRYRNYTTEQMMMMLCERYYRFYKGTKIEKDGTIYILANLKKDENKPEHQKYRDHFKTSQIFQWESETNTTLDSHRGLIGSKVAHLFIRKIADEDGITLPYTYIGTGKLVNPIVSDNPKKTLIFDVLLDRPIPEYLHYDFKIEEENNHE